QPFMWVRNGFPIATGRLSLSASFESAGSSVRDVVGSFSGSGIIDMNGLELDGLENEALLAILASADADGFELESENISRLVSSVIASGKFFANEVSVPFTMAAGVLRMPNIVMTDTGSTVRGEARLDLADQDVDARFDVEFDPEENALTGAAPALSIAFLGSVRAPERTLDVGEFSNYLSLRAFERERRRVEILQAVVLENQRMRREALLARQQARDDREAAIERRRLEAERLTRERQRQERERIARLEAEQREKEEAEAERLRAEEAARRAEEEARRAEEEEKARLLDEAQARAAQQFADRLARGEAAPPTLEDDFIRQLEDAVRQAGEQDGQQGNRRRELPELQFNFETFSE
ncbi:MAG: AsmA-like C-terminal region-containing protein, partial [Pseudomonadota bacterium]